MPFILDCSNDMLCLPDILYIIFKKLKEQGEYIIGFICNSVSLLCKEYGNIPIQLEFTMMNNWWRICHYGSPKKKILVTPLSSSNRPIIYCKFRG